jgi:hypothetical protein
MNRWFAVMLSLAGCAPPGQPPTTDAGASDRYAADLSMDAGENPIHLDAGVPENPDVWSSCADACALRAANPGLCPLGWAIDEEMPPDGGFASGFRCDALCPQLLGTLPPDAGSIVRQCVGEDPLCYQSIDQCVLAKLYPDGIPFAKLILHFVDIPVAAIGTQIVGRIHIGGDADSTTSGSLHITGPSATLVITPALIFPWDIPALATWWWDENVDGNCDLDTGEVGVATLQFVRDYQQTSLVAEIPFADRDYASCDGF